MSFFGVQIIVLHSLIESTHLWFSSLADAIQKKNNSVANDEDSGEHTTSFSLDKYC